MNLRTQKNKLDNYYANKIDQDFPKDVQLIIASHPRYYHQFTKIRERIRLAMTDVYPLSALNEALRDFYYLHQIGFAKLKEVDELFGIKDYVED